MSTNEIVTALKTLTNGKRPVTLPALPVFLDRRGEKTTKEIAAERAALNAKERKLIGPDRELTMPKGEAKRKQQQAAKVRADGLKEGGKKAQMVDMVCVPEGATELAICEALGWKACLVTLRRACDEANVTLTRVPVPGAKSRYVGTPKGSKAPTKADVEALSAKHAVAKPAIEKKPAKAQPEPKAKPEPDYAKMGGPELVATFNALAEARGVDQVKRFATRAAGIARIKALVNPTATKAR